ncbi:Pimeloyl-ACP methyl ester carboxylesterase [Desulfuromusa kysingii]|uniref:Pimeloyl-ACP methyl ester carboxylesterase n=1 Tax=Desulfuromusa kysingii TaxID=37625 RepID=A0A1H3YBR8_9BACT|nr:alpha/beta fold hydrolase [Desulfuromusa kysingii]SEA08454.1 Pimeloyl-ACP methyl ester carboxylesterase [Desulfuromusa kysingii]
MQSKPENIHLAYDEAGTGQAVLLIHGFPLNRQMWQPQIEALSAAGFRVIAPDLRGFGESEAGESPGTVEAMVDDLINLLDRLQVEKAVVAGMSMGGYLLLDLLQRYPQRISAACFVVTRSDADDETGRAKRDHLIAEIEAGRPQTVADAFLPVLFAPHSTQNRPELIAKVQSWMTATSTTGLIHGLQAIRDRRDATPLLATLQLPTLIIGAEDDQAIPPEKSIALAAQIPASRLAMLSAVGHLGNLENGDLFNEVLISFLRSVQTV